MEPFHIKLKRLRKEKGLSMKALSQKIGVPASTYRDWEYGASVLGQPYIKIAEALDVSLHQLLGNERPKNESLLKLIARLESITQELKKEVLPLI
jgi:transcriptional regulator with XRE-family HTH domain